MKPICFLLFLAFGTTFAYTQDLNENDLIIEYFEPMPSFPGGLDGMKIFIRENLKYPNGRICCEWNVFVGFVVNEDGMLSDIKIIKGITDLCDSSALDVIKKMPKWDPAVKNNKAVRVRVVVPIKFNLNVQE